MSEPTTLKSARYAIFSLVKDSPVGIDLPGAKPDQVLHLNPNCAALFVEKLPNDEYKFGICGYPYIGVDLRVPGVPVIATHDAAKNVVWRAKYIYENVFTLVADFNPNIVWTVENQTDPKSQIVADPLQAGPPPTQLFVFREA